MLTTKCRRKVGLATLVMLSVLAGGCESGTAIEHLPSAQMADPRSDAPSFAGLWDLYIKGADLQYQGRLICDGSGDPREFQGNPRVWSLLHVGTVLLNGKPQCLENGQAYIATASVQQAEENIHAVINVGVQHESGAVSFAVFDFDATLTGIGNVDEATAIADSVHFPGGMIVDSADGILVESGSLIQEPYREESPVIAIRSLLY